MNKEEISQQCSVGTETQMNYHKPVYSSLKEDTGIALTIELPGATKKEIKISSENNTLSITAKRTADTPDDWQLISQTLPADHYKLDLELHNSLNLAATKASFTNGILTLQIAKHESTLPREISIID